QQYRLPLVESRSRPTFLGTGTEVPANQGAPNGSIVDSTVSCVDCHSVPRGWNCPGGNRGRGGRQPDGAEGQRGGKGRRRRERARSADGEARQGGGKGGQEERQQEPGDRRQAHQGEGPRHREGG